MPLNTLIKGQVDSLGEVSKGIFLDWSGGKQCSRSIFQFSKRSYKEPHNRFLVVGKTAHKHLSTV